MVTVDIGLNLQRIIERMVIATDKIVRITRNPMPTQIPQGKAGFIANTFCVPELIQQITELPGSGVLERHILMLEMATNCVEFTAMLNKATLVVSFSILQ